MKLSDKDKIIELLRNVDHLREVLRLLAHATSFIVDFSHDEIEPRSVDAWCIDSPDLLQAEAAVKVAVQRCINAEYDRALAELKSLGVTIEE